MAEDATQNPNPVEPTTSPAPTDADAYYGDDDSNEDIDLSFLDEDKK